MHFLLPQSKSVIENLKLPNYPICSGQDVGWNGHTDLLGGFQIDDKLKLGGLLNG
jgi:hypothetical protein